MRTLKIFGLPVLILGLSACATDGASDNLTAVEPAAVAAEPANGEADAGSPQQTAAAEQSSDDDKDRVVCKTVQITGSRFGKKECLTVREREERARRSREYTDETRANALRGSIPNN